MQLLSSLSAIVLQEALLYNNCCERSEDLVTCGEIMSLIMSRNHVTKFCRLKASKIGLSIQKFLRGCL